MAERLSLVRKIIVIKVRAMGDTVLTTVALQELRARFPRAKIHVVVQKEWAPLLENHPACDRAIPFEFREERVARARNTARLAFKLHPEKYDLAIGLHSSPSMAMVLYATGARVRSIHLHGFKDRNLCSTVEIPGKGEVKPIIERDMDALRALGFEIPPGQMPKLYVTGDERALAQRFFADHGLKGPVLGIAIGASRPTKIWPFSSFAELAKRWQTLTGGSVYSLSSAGESLLVQNLQEECSRVGIKVHSFQGLEIRPLMGLLAESAALVGNDSGPRHLAVALSIPTVTLIGPEHPLEWHPYPREQHPYLYLEDLSCRRDAPPGYPQWCGLSVCTVEKHRCMTGISVESVLTELQRVARGK